LTTDVYTGIMETIGPSKIIPLLNADQIFLAEKNIIESTQPGENLYLSHYSLPTPGEVPSVGTPASSAQRELLSKLVYQVQKNKVNAYVIADNSRTPENPWEKTHNEKAIQFLHETGTFVLPYPKDYVAINHSKFVGNERAVVISSCNASRHSADSPDDNTGFLMTGPAAQNGITQSFMPQWNFSVEKDSAGWSKGYRFLNRDGVLLPDNVVAWLNTAPKEELHQAEDRTEIKSAYEELIDEAADAPAESYLYFEHFDLSHIHLTFKLLSAKEKNPSLDLRFIIDPNQYLEGLKNGGHDARVIAYDLLKNAKIPVRFALVRPHPNGDKDPQRFHDKYAVFNDCKVLNGSGNFSSHALDGNGVGENHPSRPHPHNREIDVLVRDPQVARISLAIATKIRRRFSKCSSSLASRISSSLDSCFLEILESFVTPSTKTATSFPNSFRISSNVTAQSSTTSCNSAAAIVAESNLSCVMIFATSIG